MRGEVFFPEDLRVDRFTFGVVDDIQVGIWCAMRAELLEVSDRVGAVEEVRFGPAVDEEALSGPRDKLQTRIMNHNVTCKL